MQGKPKKPEAQLTPEQLALLRQLEKQQDQIQQLRDELLKSARVKAQPEEPPSPKTLRDRIQEVLTKNSMDTTWLIRTLHMDKPKYREQVLKEVADLKTEGLIANVGYEDSPIWTWRVGDNVDNATLRAVITRLISERPMYVQDITRAIGASEKRVDNEIVNIRRHPPVGHHVIDMSPLHGYKPHNRAKMYFLATIEVRDASLQPSKNRGG